MENNTSMHTIIDGNFVKQEFLPEQLKGQQIYTPGNNKKENEFRTYLKRSLEG